MTAAGRFDLIIRLIRESLAGHVRLYIWGLVCVIGIAASTAGFAYSTRIMVNDVFTADSKAAVWAISAAIVALAAIRGGSTYFHSIITAKIRQSVVASLEERQFAKLMAMDAGYFAGSHPSTHIANLLFGARGAGEAVIMLTNSVAKDVLTLIALVFVMLLQDVFMTFAAIVILPLTLLGVRAITRKVRKLAQREVDVNADVAAVGTEAIEGIRTIKSFGLQNKSRNAFSTVVRRLEAVSVKITRTSAITSVMMELIGGIIIGFFILYASWQTIENSKTAGEYMAFITAFLFAYEPGKRLAQFSVVVSKQLVAVRNVYGLLDATSAERPAIGKARLLDAKGEITFRDVSFGYGDDAPAVHQLSFTISPGEKLAIVGRSGAGKTTLVNLLLGFVSPDAGQIKLDGQDLQDLGAEDLRRNIALISQDVFLFDGTIAENIGDGNPEATQQDIEHVAKISAVMEFAKDLPNGLESSVGPNGRNLSGGQKQRVAIARALLKPAPIVIYDEATSALDGESERTVISANFDQGQIRTVISIAHRLSTIQHCDRILVLDAGYLIAQGTHEELVKSSEVYRSIFHLDA